MLDDGLVGQVLDVAMRRGGQFAELFVEDARSTSAVLDDGRVEDLVTGRDRGAGVRVVVGETTGFAHTADLTEAGLARAAEARGRSGPVRRRRGPHDRAGRVLAAGTLVVVDPESVPKATKVALLRQADEAARSQGDAIVQVAARYGDTRRRTLVANSDGVLAREDQTRTLFSVSCVAKGDGGLQTGRETVGRSAGFELFDRYEIDEIARLAGSRALAKLPARPAPSGTLPVVIAAGSGGILFHEACGHGLEADLVAKAASTFAGRVGEQVASPLVTVIDDGTMAGEWGHLGYDDEGRPAQRNVLIEDGVLTDYLWDLLRLPQGGPGQFR